MTREENALFEFIEDLLGYEWDPLGVHGGAPGDHYQPYVPELFNLAVGNGTAEQIAVRLRCIETETLRAKGDFEECKRLARIIVQKKQALLGGPSGTL